MSQDSSSFPNVPAPSKLASERIFAIDFLKAISIAAVVSYHSVFIPASNYPAELEAVLFAPFKFCVPIFFTISFLLLEGSLEKSKHKSKTSLIKKRVLRLIIPVSFWFGISAILGMLAGDTLTDLLKKTLNGTLFIGAYYLLVLLQLLPIFVWIREWFKNLKVIFLIILAQALLYVLIYVILTDVHHSEVAASIISILKNISRPLIIYWFAYMAMGACLYRNWKWVVQKSMHLSVKIKIFLMISLCFSFIFEYSWLLSIVEGDVSPFNYTMLSCLLSVPIFFLCFASIQESDFLPTSVTVFQVLSKYSLGIFCINGILSKVFLHFGSHLIGTAILNLPELLLMKLVGWIVLLLSSLLLAVLIDRIGLGACVR